MDIMRVTDVALKATNVKPGMLIIERLYGMLEVHSESQADVRAAGRAILDMLGLKEEERIKPEVFSSQVIRNISPYHTQLINRTRHGDMIMPGQSLYVMECAPAGYAALAANEAEKAANINILEVRAFGSFGRVYLGGEERDIDVAYRAAEMAIESVAGRAAAVSGSQKPEARSQKKPPVDGVASSWILHRPGFWLLTSDMRSNRSNGANI